MYGKMDQVSLIIIDEQRCYNVTVPGRDEQEGIAFLEAIGGTALGGGLRTGQLDTQFPAFAQNMNAV